MPRMTPCPDAPSSAAENGAQRIEDLSAAIRASSPRLHALAQRMLGSHHAAEDAVQTATLRALESLHRYRGEASMGTWLYRITANVCLDELRRPRRVTLEAIPERGITRLVGNDIGDTVVRQVEVAEALATLPAAHRAALVLTDICGYSYADAGTALGVPSGTVASRRHRAKENLRALLHNDRSVGRAA